MRALEYCDFLSTGGFRLYYNDAVTKPGTDAFLLGSFPRLRRGLRVCDLGAGIGLLGLILLPREAQLQIVNVELDEQAAEMAARNIAENHLSDRMQLLHADLCNLSAFLPAGETDLVLSNPPYFRTCSGGVAKGATRRAAREELNCSIDDICAAAARLLRWGGTFCAVYRPERLCDLLVSMRSNGIEPKRIRLVQKNADSAPILFLIEGRRGGQPGLSYDAPLAIYGADGRETAEMDRINFRSPKEESLP